jgi:phosphatidylglycerol:prolipoprotein diacylglycerol transferase
VSSPPGLFFGRLANFINAELWGRPTEKPWGIIFPGDRAQVCEGVIGFCARHPSQLYEAFSEGLLLFMLLFLIGIFGGFKRPGLITGCFAFCYGLARFFIEYVRVPDPQFFSIMNPHGFAFVFGDYGVTMGQVLSLPMILVGAVLFCTSVLRKKKTAKNVSA